jgi:UDP-N-acetylmuramate dehydrogenase
LTTQNWLQDLRSLWADKLRIDEPMSRHTSFRIGGPAQALLLVDTTDDLCEAVLWARRAQVPYHVIGQGSNLLAADAGIAGLVIVNRCREYRIARVDGTAVVYAESGIGLGTLAREVGRAGWAGLEWATGIPGTLGGAITGNAGAFGAEIGGALSKVHIMDGGGERREWHGEDLHLTYRSSRFKEEACVTRREFIILAAELVLEEGDIDEIARRTGEFARVRRRNQPVGEPSAGSVFKNPPEDHAGRLIEAAGLMGTRIGGAQISPRHANFIVNVGDATAEDVVELIRLVRCTVGQRFSHELELEIELIGRYSQLADVEKES